MAAEFCVVCGRTDRPLVEGICPDCSAGRTRLVGFEGHPSVLVCATCGARKVGQHWERRGASPSMLTGEDLTPLLAVHPDVAIRRVRWTETAADPVQRTYQGEVDLRFRDTERTVTVEMPVRVKVMTCSECSRRTGHFYTALIQVRGTSERLRGSSAELRDRLERAFEGGVLSQAKSEWRDKFSWREALPEGWDYYLVDTLAARSVARFAKSRLGAKLTESATLWGRKNGKDVYRVTFCLRIPDAVGAERTATRSTS